MTKLTLEAVKAAMASVSRLKPRHQIPEAARILGVHDDTVRRKLKKGPKRQHTRRPLEVLSNGIEIPVDDVPAVYGPIDPDDDVMNALREHMGDEWPTEFA
jgi:hypothetical protein